MDGDVTDRGGHRGYDQFCALARALDHVGQRWSLLVVRELLLGPRRFTDLRAGLPGIANNLLTDRLRQLEADGIVERRELPPPAASTVYALTAVGEELREPVEGLIRWGGRWMTSGPGDDHFRFEWLTLALGALGVGDRMAPGTTIELVVDDVAIRLGVEDGRLTAASPDDPGRTLRVIAHASTILGLAAGAIPAERAMATIAVVPDEPGAVATAIGILAPPGPDG